MVEWKRQWYHEWKDTPQGKKSIALRSWKRKGLKESREFIDQIYDEYLLSTQCELCGEAYSEHNVKNMEHDHNTGKFRNIVCHRCNSWKEDKPSKFIGWDKTTNKYRVNVRRNYRLVLNKNAKTEEQAKEILNRFKEDHPYYFT